ncbi:MAG TPA: FmdB family zinc ribbon protein [Aggregatilineales bacterium]|nr:FmdB family zinc ribbon protein [Aggregatilineales bacterium]
MPMYTYECENCGERFEAKQSFNDPALTVCPTCEGHIYRVIQPVGIVFKGSGFYVTDSKGKNNLATSGTRMDEKPSEGGDSKTTESKPAEAKATETKTEAKAETKPS